MKTTLLALLGVSLFLGGCSSQLTGTIARGGPVFYTTEHADDRDPHATLDWNAALHPLAQPSRTQR